MPRNQKIPNIPTNGGWKNVVGLLITIEQQEVSTIGRVSRR